MSFVGNFYNVAVPQTRNNSLTSVGQVMDMLMIRMGQGYINRKSRGVVPRLTINRSSNKYKFDNVRNLFDDPHSR